MSRVIRSRGTQSGFIFDESNPVLKNRTILYHTAFWTALYLFWLIIFRSYSISITKTVTIEFCYLLFITADFYAINNYIIPRFLFRKKYLLFISSTLLIIVVSAWIRANLAMLMNRYFFHGVVGDFATVYVSSLINISLWVLFVTTIKLVFDRIKTQRQLELLERERIKNELDYLKAQINPHALLNSLNTVYGHIDKNSQSARNVLLQFSELLKYQLYECGADRVELGKELAYIENYVAFQKLRKGDNLEVNIRTKETANNMSIAPLLIIVLVENAFKFVSNVSNRQNKIDIEITANNQWLSCMVANTTEEQSARSTDGGNGIGIANLKRRLALLYPDKHKIDINIEENVYRTNLMLQLS